MFNWHEGKITQIGFLYMNCMKSYIPTRTDLYIHSSSFTALPFLNHEYRLLASVGVHIISSHAVTKHACLHYLDQTWVVRSNVPASNYIIWCVMRSLTMI